MLPLGQPTLGVLTNSYGPHDHSFISSSDTVAQHSFISEAMCYSRCILYSVFAFFTSLPGLGILKVAILESKVMIHRSYSTFLLPDHVKVLITEVADSLSLCFWGTLHSMFRFCLALCIALWNLELMEPTKIS